MMQQFGARVPFRKRMEYASTGAVLAAAILLLLAYTVDPSRSSVGLAWAFAAAAVLWWIGVRVLNAVQK